jgi:hypothetical protein
VFRKGLPALSRAEIDGLIVLLMRIDANIDRIKRVLEESHGEADE